MSAGFFKPGFFETEINGELCSITLCIDGTALVKREKHSDILISLKDLIELLDGQKLLT